MSVQSGRLSDVTACHVAAPPGPGFPWVGPFNGYGGRKLEEATEGVGSLAYKAVVRA